ncbi:MAG: hypothetical protein ACYCRE_04310, partial [Acidobacteriaceae bacterium]
MAAIARTFDKFPRKTGTEFAGAASGDFFAPPLFSTDVHLPGVESEDVFRDQARAEAKKEAWPFDEIKARSR